MPYCVMFPLRMTDRGLACEAGGFYIDPWGPVERAVITHAHADHTCKGCRHYLASREGRHVLRTRLGNEASIRTRSLLQIVQHRLCRRQPRREGRSQSAGTGETRLGDLHGPHTFNFVETYADMRGAGGAALVRNDRDLALAIKRLFAEEKTRYAMADAARRSAEKSAERVLSDVVAMIRSESGERTTAAR